MIEYSVVIPFYNDHSTIRDALFSLALQKNLAKKIIIIDDCSSIPLNLDKLLLDEKISHLNIDLIRNSQNLGPAKSRNKGLRASKTLWTFFLDSDDEWSKDKISTISNHIEEDTILIGHSTIHKNGKVFGSNCKKTYKGISLLTFLYTNIGQTSTIGIRGSYRFSNGYYSEDHQMVYRIALFALIFKCEIVYIPEALTYIKRIQNTKGGLSGNKTKMRISLIIRIFLDSIRLLFFALIGFTSLPIQVLKHLLKILFHEFSSWKK